MSRVIRVTGVIWLALVVLMVSSLGISSVLHGAVGKWTRIVLFTLVVAACASWAARSLSRSGWILSAVVAAAGAWGVAAAVVRGIAIATARGPFVGVLPVVALFTAYPLVLAGAIVGLVVLLDRLRSARAPSEQAFPAAGASDSVDSTARRR